MSKKPQSKSEESDSKVMDTKALNQEAEDALVAAQWEQVERLGLDKFHSESLNSKKE